MQALIRVGDAVIDAGLWVAKLAVVGMLTLITSEIVARTLFGTALMVVDEFSGYLLVAMTFFGLAYCLRQGSLLRIELVLHTLPERMQVWLQFVFNLASLGLVALILGHQVRFTWSTFSRGMVAPTLSEIPLWIPQLAIPVGMAMLVLALLLELADDSLRIRGQSPTRPRVANPDLEP